MTNLIYTTNGGVLSVIDGATNKVTYTISAGGGGVAVNPATNKIYSTCSYGCGSLSVINGSTNTVVATIDGVGSGAYVSINSNTNTVYTANGTGNTVSAVGYRSPTFQCQREALEGD
jgi:YVTN family beta-propeller protein